MNFKRIIAFLLATMMLFSVCACKKDEAAGDKTTAKETEKNTDDTTETEPMTDAPVDVPAGDPQFINPLTGLAS